MKKILIISLLLVSTQLFGQEGVSTVGIQFKPIIPSNIFRAGDYNVVSDRSDLNYQISQQLGYSFGMIVRSGINKNWSVETGIKYTRRNYRFSVDNSDNGDTYEESFTIVGYEIPTLILLNVRLDKQVYMNTAFGPSIDMFPSNVGTYTYEFRQYSIRNSWIQLSLKANLGWEYRTKKDGTIYLGGSFHRPFSSIYRTRITYVNDDYIDEPIGALSGNYLTIDIRYFFHEDPEKKTKKTK